MAATNDVTGDAIRSAPTEKYRDNYDAIFRKKPEMKISRIDIISTNGNDGEHYQEVDDARPE
jgi:uncharacterized protein YnzC (UPF0291/DUF896 family)